MKIRGMMDTRELGCWYI